MSAHTTLQQDLDRQLERLNSNRLTVNAKKTKYIIFTTKQKSETIHPLPLKLNRTDLQYVPHYEVYKFG